MERIFLYLFSTKKHQRIWQKVIKPRACHQQFSFDSLHIPIALCTLDKAKCNGISVLHHFLAFDCYSLSLLAVCCSIRRLFWLLKRNSKNEKNRANSVSERPAVVTRTVSDFIALENKTATE